MEEKTKIKSPVSKISKTVGVIILIWSVLALIFSLLGMRFTLALAEVKWDFLFIVMYNISLLIYLWSIVCWIGLIGVKKRWLNLLLTLTWVSILSFVLTIINWTWWEYPIVILIIQIFLSIALWQRRKDFN